MLIRSLLLCLISGLAFRAYAFPALTYSTYLRDGFTPQAIATDSIGNIYIAGNTIVDPATSQTTVLVVKLNPQASQYLYVRYLGGSAGDFASAIAVDGAGNVYVAGYTVSPDFPVTPGGNLGTRADTLSQRSFVAKFDPSGVLLFSDILGGTAASVAQAVAVTAAGQIVVSGMVSSGRSEFPSTAGAYSIPSTLNHPYLLELDPTGTKTIFSATGIGGSALAIDSSGNIYVAGTTTLLDYPTTPGAYQTTFPAVSNCPSPDCAFPFPGTNQYVTKVDPSGSKLIYSTAVTGTRNTANGGLALDGAGNVYLTGFAGTTYPYTVAVPSLPVEQSPAYLTLPFLSKLDPAGRTLLFSVPVGGAGVQVDANGLVYAGGYVGARTSVGVLSNISALANVPNTCLPNSGPGSNRIAAYASQVDGVSGNLLGSRFIGGSTLSPSGVALSGSTLWIAGAASLPDFPITPTALTIAKIGPGAQPGAYLGAVDFSQAEPPVGTPQIGCLLDAANLAQAGPVARYQVLTILGTGLGPTTGVNATDDSTTSLAGVSVNFGSTAAPLLYVSSTQINFAMPLVSFSQSSAVMQLTVNGVSSASLALPLTTASPGLFPTTLNEDGSQNSQQHAAALGSTISIFVNGLSGLPLEFPRTGLGPAQLLLSTDSGWSVTKIAPATKFVTRVDMQIPSKPPAGLVFCPPNQSPCNAPMGFSLYYFDPYATFPIFTGRALEGSVYVTLPK